MPPPRQDANVTRDCIFYKILRYCGSKAVGSLEKFLCKTKVSDGTATFAVARWGEGVQRTGEGLIGRQEVQLLENNKQNICGNVILNLPYSLGSLYKTQVAGAATTLPKQTYSPINLFSYSPHKKAAFTLAEDATHVAHFVDVRRGAFTLAEVLITLGIIGIVAAMTMPSLITNYQKQRAVTQLKKSYTNLAEAVKRSELENDTVANWNFDLPAEEFYNTYLSGFLSVNNSTVAKSNIEYKFLNRNTCTLDFCIGNSHIAYLADGSSILISKHIGLHIGRVVSIDINGNKRPNTIGKDFFQFAITKDNGVVPFGYGNFGVTDPGGNKYQNFGNYDRDKITGTDNYACNKDKYGIWCPALIIMDGWTMSKDYPW